MKLSQPIRDPWHNRRGRPDWRPRTGVPGSDFQRARQQGLDAFGTRFAICNCLHGAQMLFSEDLAAVLLEVGADREVARG